MLMGIDLKPYKKSDTTKKQEVTSMFDGIAPYYDFLNRLLSLGIDTIWRKKAIAMLKDDQPKQMLDIATGTGDLALEAYKQLKPDHIIGLDISQQMLEFGKEKISKKGLSDQISMVHGDSEQLPYEKDRFDAITAAFGVRNFENVDKGLKEMLRVLKPGGKLVVLEFTRPKFFPFKQLFNFYFANILPWIGKKKSKDKGAYKYLYESVQAFPDYDRFTDVLKQNGFRSTNWKSLSFGICAIYTAKK